MGKGGGGKDGREGGEICEFRGEVISLRTEKRVNVAGKCPATRVDVRTRGVQAKLITNEIADERTKDYCSGEASSRHEKRGEGCYEGRWNGEPGGIACHL